MATGPLQIKLLNWFSVPARQPASLGADDSSMDVLTYSGNAVDPPVRQLLTA
jgi:hypothetical protein